MKVLFDNGTPNPLARRLVGHQVTFARRAGWAELANGELIQKAEESGFDLLFSTDKNIRYQQNLKNRKIALVILGNGNWPIVEPHTEAILAAVNSSAPGSYTEVPIPFPQETTESN